MTSLKPKPAVESQVTLTQLMGPGAANTMGNVHGGYIVKLCDEAGGIAANKHARRPVVTVVLDSMTFHSPVHIGDLLTVSAAITWTGRTSMETRVLVTAENVISGTLTHTNTAYIVYVALDDYGRPTTVPQLLRQSSEEEKRFQRAAERQNSRLRSREQES